MKMLMGVGNTLRQDDGIGIYVAHRMAETEWTTLDCSTAPENFTSVVRRAQPEVLVLVDAAQMDLTPGEFRIVHRDMIQDVSIGTHHLPLTHLIDYLKDAAGTILFVGIQPALIGDGEGLSDEVVKGAEELIRILKKGEFGALKAL
jgi:hydrogenase 3 maturation protease